MESAACLGCCSPLVLRVAFGRSWPVLLWCSVATQSFSSRSAEAAKAAERFGRRLGASPSSVSEAERLREGGRFTAVDEGCSACRRASKSRLVVGGARSELPTCGGPEWPRCVEGAGGQPHSCFRAFSVW